MSFALIPLRLLVSEEWKLNSDIETSFQEGGGLGIRFISQLNKTIEKEECVPSGTNFSTSATLKSQKYSDENNIVLKQIDLDARISRTNLFNEFKKQMSEKQITFILFHKFENQNQYNMILTLIQVLYPGIFDFVIDLNKKDEDPLLTLQCIWVLYHDNENNNNNFHFFYNNESDIWIKENGKIPIFADFSIVLHSVSSSFQKSDLNKIPPIINLKILNKINPVNKVKITQSNNIFEKQSVIDSKPKETNKQIIISQPTSNQKPKSLFIMKP